MNRLNNLVEFWSEWLIHSGWQAAIVVGLVSVLLPLMRRRCSSQFRYVLLLIVLAKFAAPPFFNLSVGLFSQSRYSASREIAIEVAPPHEVRNVTIVRAARTSDAGVFQR